MLYCFLKAAVGFGNLLKLHTCRQMEEEYASCVFLFCISFIQMFCLFLIGIPDLMFVFAGCQRGKSAFTADILQGNYINKCTKAGIIFSFE